ncbi:MAG: hypothetical protein EHM19_09875 [Candidatus Latescibacterota bacterium]|nr:MAG: hypothetical protein EHM19_09875 [Candidatus Latescibacterota bacterium]
MAVIRYARVAALVAGLWAATGAGAANDPVAEEAAVRERSIESFQQLLSKYPESSMRAPVLLLLGDLYAEREKSRYLAEVGRAETGGTPESAPALDYTEAIGAYEEVAALGAEFAGSVEALHALGVCYDEMGRADEAERVLAQASGLTADPALRASSLLRLGDLRFSRENWPGALDAYRAADEAGADAAAEKLDYRIGWCHLKQGELEEARARFAAALDGALRGDPGSRPEESLSEILRSLALVQVQTDPSDPEGFAARFPDGPCRRAALVEFGEVLLEHDRPEYGERALRQALSMDRQAADAPEVHDHIVEALSAEERKREAGAEMEKFVERYAPGGD